MVKVWTLDTAACTMRVSSVFSARPAMLEHAVIAKAILSVCLSVRLS